MRDSCCLSLKLDSKAFNFSFCYLAISLSLTIEFLTVLVLYSTL